MKILVFLCLLALAMGKECAKERTDVCVDSLLTVMLGYGTTAEDICRELKTSIACLKDAIDECVDDGAEREEVEEALRELVKQTGNVCDDAVDNEMEKCLKENENYVYECIYEGRTAAVFLLMRRKIDPSNLGCMLYTKMTDCYATKISKSCGSKAGSIARSQLLAIGESPGGSCEQASHQKMLTPYLPPAATKQISPKPNIWSVFR